MQSDIVQRLKELRAFLDGSGELNGLSFGDDPPIINGIRRAFWWRKELTALDEAAAELARLTEALRNMADVVAVYAMQPPHPTRQRERLAQDQWDQIAQVVSEMLRAALKEQPHADA